MKDSIDRQAAIDEAEYDANPDRLRKACYELTGIDVAETVTKER